MELALARYRLRFIHPFGTAHGLREGTDSVFVRLSRNGFVGYGEATLPPYLPHTQDSAHEELRSIDIKSITDLLSGTNEGLSPPARCALDMAYNDLLSKEMGISYSSFIGISRVRGYSPQSMVTLGHTAISDIALKLEQLPNTPVLKVKLGSPHDQITLTAVKELDNRMLFLDANQGWDHLDQAMNAISTVGEQRIVGIEQPFHKDRWDLHRALREAVNVPIYADESVQDLEDLKRASGAFDGVNVKLMKCGGLDVAKRMVEFARQEGLKIMLGSMSESSLGCAAMAALLPFADLVDLDGPWLISNDPFHGLRMEDGQLAVDGPVGMGVELRLPSLLEFHPLGA